MASNGPTLWDVLSKFLPWTWKEFARSIVFLFIFLSLYYISPFYSFLDQQIENAKWWSCEPKDLICGEQAEYGELEVILRVPKSVSDFLTEEIEITVKNVGKDLSDALHIAIEVSPTGNFTPTVYLYAEEGKEIKRGNTLTFPSIPPHSEVTGIYRIRVAKGQHGEQFGSKVYVNGIQIQPEFNVRMIFNRWRTLLVWIADSLLLPPGSNWLVVLLAARFAKSECLNKLLEKIFRCIRSKLQEILQHVLGPYRRKPEEG
jgi:hypothetical protein